jgi:O-antigen/teichoic acid export membrane protein
MSTFLRNWSLLTISSFIQQALGFITLVRIARVLQPELYGVYTVILTSVSIAYTFASLGLRQIVIREIARKAEVISLIAKRYSSLTIFGALVSAIGLAFYVQYSESINDGSLIFLAVIYLLSQIVWNFCESLAFGKQEMQYSSSIGIAGSVLWLASVYLLPGSSFTLKTILQIFVAIQGVRGVAYILLLWNKKYFKRVADGFGNAALTKKELLSQSLPLYGTSLLTLPITQIPILFLAQFSGKTEVGYFGVGNKLIIPITIVGTTLLSAVYPILARDFVSDHHLFEKNARRIFIGMALFGIAASWSMALFSKELIVTLLGAKYEHASAAFAVQVWVALNLVLHSFLGTLFLAANKERLMVKLSIFNAVVIGLANYFGAQYGATGLALSSWCGLLVGFAFHWYFITTYVGVRITVPMLLLITISFILFSVLSTILLDISFVLKAVIFAVSFGLFIGFINVHHDLDFARLLRIMAGVKRGTSLR